MTAGYQSNRFERRGAKRLKFKEKGAHPEGNRPGANAFGQFIRLEILLIGVDDDGTVSGQRFMRGDLCDGESHSGV